MCVLGNKMWIRRHQLDCCPVYLFLKSLLLQSSIGSITTIRCHSRSPLQ